MTSADTKPPANAPPIPWWARTIEFEHLRDPLLPWQEFSRRLARNGMIAGLLIAISLTIGALGYHVTAHLPWIDSFLNASMILAGMGPVDRMESAAGKLFATVYALFSGVAFLSIVGVLLAPVLHRFIHRFHLETEEETSGPRPPAPKD
jgi:hypothetical protein